MELPELPEPALETNGDVFGHENTEGYTAEQMRAYALGAIAAERERTLLGGQSITSLMPPGPTIADAIRDAIRAERERCARICEELSAFNMDNPGETVAAAIRAQGSKA